MRKKFKFFIFRCDLKLFIYRFLFDAYIYNITSIVLLVIFFCQFKGENKIYITRLYYLKIIVFLHYQFNIYYYFFTVISLFIKYPTIFLTTINRDIQVNDTHSVS